MRNVLVVASLAVVLVSCGKSPEDLQTDKMNIDRQLPEGCEFHFYGWYDNMRVAAIVCDNSKVTNTNVRWSEGSGKNETIHNGLVAKIEK
ncbi:hypothetical protein PQC16_gp092 [Rhizobium phage RHph_TM30]|uniref:Lipoprotein n=1 Tax=Rhizobium phage RHph_TM30 TaxID=2509764 RepID=A0A7S5UVZ1_9CAUD|nr:hypothetical protein PQC16_gp092 [Rhizobium phage RHph_TM30]QIG71199.1 hypothetical protein EVB93_092 [Rhizobium phage RHph_TM30]